eukprot:CAMPEP_0115569848 /NCGR_PEP_ID=MMETSP0271-20121206/105400_1 /TAXON_ID=71861 /ORGANISM="Scrippsiella trochoidea, Strain CCMP3099" /LENGTH=96 /DNA_ID=CAMNT_0003004377 /DNA_START=217 /DNA_END=503 /DNA_ORIENTATION=+
MVTLNRNRTTSFLHASRPNHRAARVCEGLPNSGHSKPSGGILDCLEPFALRGWVPPFIPGRTLCATREEGTPAAAPALASWSTAPPLSAAAAAAAA